jgi:cystathionine beta-lyase
MISRFDGPTLEQLRTRTSAKWTAYQSDVLPAWIAEMDVDLDPEIRSTLLAAVENSDTGYVSARMLQPSFVRFALDWFGWAVDPAKVIVAPDVLQGLAELLRALTEPGARVVVNSPVYQPFYRTIGEVERVVENVPLLHDAAGWSIDFRGLERAFASGAQAYVLCSPHNPLGRVFSERELMRVAELAQRYRVVVIADEIHAPLTFADATHVPFLRVAENVGFEDAVALWAASKAWNLAGLKCAQIVAGSDWMMHRLRAVPPELPYRASHLGVLASIAAFDRGGPWLRALIEHLDRNRLLLGELLLDALPAVRYEPPQAGYLAWLDCTALGFDMQPADVFLARGRVALSRGRDFGPEGEACVRLNFGTTAAILSEVVVRMRKSLA